MSNDPKQTALRLKNGSTLTVDDSTEIRCEVHGIVTRWGALDGIQRLAVEEGIDVSDELPCLLSPARRGNS